MWLWRVLPYLKISRLQFWRMVFSAFPWLLNGKQITIKRLNGDYLDEVLRGTSGGRFYERLYATQIGEWLAERPHMVITKLDFAWLYHLHLKKDSMYMLRLGFLYAEDLALFKLTFDYDEHTGHNLR